MKKLSFVYLFALSFLVLSSCNRLGLSKSSSTITIQTPKGGGGNAAAGVYPFPENKKVCYGVRVTGPDIQDSTNQCSSKFGLFGGFVTEGEELILEVPRGENRSFELVTHLVEPTESCPQWNESFGAVSAQLVATYFSGRIDGVNLTEEEQIVSIAIEFPGESNNLITAQNFSACTTRLKGQLFSNGDIIDILGNVLSSSSEINEGYYSTGISSDIYGIGYITAGGVLNISSEGPVEIPAYVYSVTRKPDTGEIYGLVGNGQVVSITLGGSTASISELTAATCPFAVENCKVPDWIQSISAGYGTELFSLDHGGTIYKVLIGNNLIPTGDSVPPYVTQVSYY